MKQIRPLKSGIIFVPDFSIYDISLKNIDEVHYENQKDQDKKVLWKVSQMWGWGDGY
jgi:hypothetical protein